MKYLKITSKMFPNRLFEIVIFLDVVMESMVRGVQQCGKINRHR